MPHSGYANITTNATTTVATGRSILGRIIVNNPGTSWVATIYDSTTGSGTKIGTIALNVTEEYEYDVVANNGITIVTSGTTAGDLTVIFS